MEHKHNKEHGKWIQKQNDILKILKNIVHSIQIWTF